MSTPGGLPFPKSSSSEDDLASATSTDSWSSFSATGSRLSTPLRALKAVTESVIANADTKPHDDSPAARWASNHMLLPHSSLDYTPPHRRARSPSVPNLPSYVQPTPRYGVEHDITRMLDQMNIDQPFPSYQPRPFPANDHLSSTNRLDDGFANRSLALPARLEDHLDESFDTRAYARLDHPADHPEEALAARAFPRSTHLHNLPEHESRHDSQLHPLAHHASVPSLYTGLQDHGDVLRRSSTKSLTSLVPPAPGRNVYIASVSETATDEQLKTTASRFGQVLMTRIQKVGEPSAPLVANGTSWQPTPQRHCGFVLFSKHEEAAAFIAYLRSHDRVCDYAREDFQTEWKSREDRESANLYIQGLPLSTQSEQLFALLEPYGTVVSWRFITSSDGHRRGPALARLECRPQAEAAIKGLNGKLLGGPDGPVLQVRIADSDQQKDLKRQASMTWNNDTGCPPRATRRLSIPIQPLEDRLSDHIYHRQRQQLLTQLQQLEERAITSSDLFAPRPAGYDHGAKAYAVHQEDISPFGVGRKSSTSSFAPHRKGSMQSINSSIVTPTLSRVASTRFDDYFGAAPSYHYFQPHLVNKDHSLSHVRSTLDLGANTARLLWPGHERELDE